MGGRLVCRADAVEAPSNPLKAKRWMGRPGGHACETAEPQQDSGPMGGRLVCGADAVWAPSNPLKAKRWMGGACETAHPQQDAGMHGLAKDAVVLSLQRAGKHARQS